MLSTTGRLMMWAGIMLVQPERLCAADLVDPTEVTGTRRIVVSIAHRRLALIEDGQLVRTFETAVGAPISPTPVGQFTIIHRIPRPTYYAPGKVIPPGSSNPLGTRWIGLSVKGFGIHGTNVPSSIGKAQSHGCIRMRNSEVEQLFELVRVGDVVELHGEADEAVTALFGPLEAPAATQKAPAQQPRASLPLAVGTLVR